MDFAKKQLEKYGWKEGEGLGRNKTGISKALRPKLKFDTGGLGHDVFEDINNTWWQRLYDDAAKNIVTKINQDESVLLEIVNESIHITTKKLKRKKVEKPKDTVYTDFVKTSELKHNKEKNIVENDEEEQPRIKKSKETGGICDLTDEELFKICGGRTTHKGARHGLKMNAKLARIEKQESDLATVNAEVKQFKQLEVVEETRLRKHKNKKKKHKSRD